MGDFLKKLFLLISLLFFSGMVFAENFKELKVCDNFTKFFDLGNSMLKPTSFGKNVCYCTIVDPCNQPLPIEPPIE